MKDDVAIRPEDSLGSVEYVVESRHHGELEKWLVMRADPACVPSYAALGLEVEAGARIVIEAGSLRPVGVLESALPPENFPAGYNPYFDPPAA